MPQNKNNKNNSTSKIMAVIIIIIILLLGGAFGTIVSNRTSNIKGEDSQKENTITIGSILIMPLYYVVCYPKVLINLAAGEYTESCGSPIGKRQKAKKQFIQNDNN